MKYYDVLTEVHFNSTLTLVGIMEDGEIELETKPKDRVMGYIRNRGQDGQAPRILDIPPDNPQRKEAIDNLLNSWVEDMHFVIDAEEDLHQHPDVRKWYEWTTRHARQIAQWGMEYDTQLTSMQ